MTVKEIIDLLLYNCECGKLELAELLGITPQAITVWVARNSIPERHHERIQELLQ